MAETPKRATKFFTFEQYKKIFLFGASSPTPLVVRTFKSFCAESFLNLFGQKLGAKGSRYALYLTLHLKVITTFDLSQLCFLLQTFTAAGLCSGLTEAIVINPFEVVKVKLQAERGSFKGVFSRNCLHLEIVSNNHVTCLKQFSIV